MSISAKKIWKVSSVHLVGQQKLIEVHVASSAPGLHDQLIGFIGCRRRSLRHSNKGQSHCCNRVHSVKALSRSRFAADPFSIAMNPQTRRLQWEWPVSRISKDSQQSDNFERCPWASLPRAQAQMHRPVLLGLEKWWAKGQSMFVRHHVDIGHMQWPYPEHNEPWLFNGPRMKKAV